MHTVFGIPYHLYILYIDQYILYSLPLPIKETFPFVFQKDIASFCSCHAPLLCIKYPRFPLNLAWASPPSLEGQTLELLWRESSLLPLQGGLTPSPSSLNLTSLQEGLQLYLPSCLEEVNFAQVGLACVVSFNGNLACVVSFNDNFACVVSFNGNLACVGSFNGNLACLGSFNGNLACLGNGYGISSPVENVYGFPCTCRKVMVSLALVEKLWYPLHL